MTRRFPRLVCSTIRSCTRALMTWEPRSIVIWALFSCRSNRPPGFFFFYHLCRTSCLFCFLWDTKCVERRFRCLKRPNYFVKWLRFLLKVSFWSRDTLCCRFSWAFWCLIVWIFSRNDGVDRRNLSTTLNIVCARVYAFTSMPSIPLCRFLLFDWTKLVCQFLRKLCRAFHNCFWLALFESTARFSWLMCNLHFAVWNEFCVLCYVRSFDNCFCCFFIRNSPEVAFRRSRTVSKPFALNNWCSCWEVSLCNPSIMWEVVSSRGLKQTGGLRNSSSKNNWSRIVSPFKIVLALSFHDYHKFRREYRRHWLNRWDPWSSLLMLQWRPSTCFRHLASFLIWESSAILSGLDVSVQDTRP